MRNLFKGYYTPTSSEIDEMWERGVFTFDASFLLNLYRYSQSTCDELLQVLKKLESRIWLPYQAGLEFHRNRFKVIKEQEESYQSLIETLDKDEIKLINQLGSDRHPYVSSSEEIVQKIKELFKEIKIKLKQQLDDYKKLIKDDFVLNEITELFHKKVGKKYGDEDLNKIFKEGEIRYEKKIPPGYEDIKDKEGERKYGDLIIWYQIIDFAKENKKNILFITSDQKEDWWKKSKGEILGPCPELIEEINEKASAKFYMYRVEPFLNYAQKYLKTRINKKTIDEVKAVRDILNRFDLQKERFNEIIRNDEMFKNLSNTIKINEEILKSKQLSELMKQNSRIFNNLDLAKPLFSNDKIIQANERINSAQSKMEQLKDLEDRLNKLILISNDNISQANESSDSDNSRSK